MQTIVKKLTEAFKASGIAAPEILTNCSDKQELYDRYRQIFNIKFQFMPLAIVLCENQEQISVMVRFTSDEALPLRVRGGGHDHEGECSGTDTVLLDLSKMDKVEIGPGYARIQPGIIFRNLTTLLADHDVMIPHGTCATVCIAGYTLGGGWGPWTRKHGMCCESVIEATLVLGDGSIKTVRMEEEEKEHGLLWAIKGGGGFSYGIVTEFVIRTFELPDEMIKFQIEWNPFKYQPEHLHFAVHGKTPTITILKAWENAIATTEGLPAQLVGTNLKISAKSAREGEEIDMDHISHNCVMYGYWEGDEDSLNAFIEQSFAGTGDYQVKILGRAGKNHKHLKYGENLMSSWDRFSLHNVQLLMQGLEGTPFPPDEDQPAPHKITSRLVEAQGLQHEGYKKLLESLTSPLIIKGNRRLGLFTYITLGAITGKYYQEISELQKTKSAFPYKDRLYTIQYQTWWDETEKEKAKGTNNEVYTRVNRALDWMEVCRNFRIPNTSGAFISFKDSSVPTKTYFSQSYQELINIKHKYSKDPRNHFRSRKTII